MNINIPRVAVVASLLFAGRFVQAEDQPVSVAVGRTGQTAFEFVGSIEQSGDDMKLTGYITSIAGLAESQLFTDPTTRSPNTARFSIVATGKLTSRNVASPLFVLDAVSTASINFNAGTLFSSAGAIASANSTLQTVVHVISPFTAQSPGRGLFTASGEFVRTTADNFELDGVTYRFGEANRVMRITMVGDGILMDPTGPISTITVAGTVVVGDYLPQP